MTDNISAASSAQPTNSQQASPESSTPAAENAIVKASEKKPKKENVLVNILMNIVIPTLILTKMSGDNFMGTQWGLGAKWGLVVALAFPISYGIFDFMKHRKFNFFSGLGIVSVLLTGGISLLHLDTKYYAIKEAAIPGIIGLMVLFSTKTRFPLVKTFIYNESILQVEKVTAALKAHDNTAAFEKTLRLGSYLIAASFFISSALNYILAKMIVVSPTGTEAFNIEVGKMNALSFPVIAVPSMFIMVGTLFYIFRSIRLLTSLTMEDVMHGGNDTDNNK
ncbi:MAG: VC0807 family protein [Pseudomonadota bacterium]